MICFIDKLNLYLADYEKQKISCLSLFLYIFDVMVLIPKKRSIGLAEFFDPIFI